SSAGSAGAVATRWRPKCPWSGSSTGARPRTSWPGPPRTPTMGRPHDLARDLPRDKGLFYEPKWDGFRCIVFRDGDDVELGSRNEKPLTRYFPELVAALARELPARCVLDGEIVIAGPTGLDFDALSQRIHPAAKRINQLAAATP